MEHRQHRRSDALLVPLLVSVFAAAASAGPQQPPSGARERPPATQAPVRPSPPPAAKPPSEHGQDAARSLDERRAIAKDAARFESKYRNAVARINRLIEVYKGKGDQEHVLQLERLRERLAVRREHAMEGFRKELGEAGFQRMQGQLQGEARRSLEQRTKKGKPPSDNGGAR